MCTHLGVSTQLAPPDVEMDRLDRCKYSYIEGYLWDADAPRRACVETMEQSRQRGTKVSFTFSDPYLVDRFADDFRSLISEYCDTVFCNADEMRMFFGTDCLDECAAKLQPLVELSFITHSEHGCIVVTPESITPVPGFPVEAVDTVGAGDAFAGGVLYGLTNGLPAVRAARWGNYMASRVVLIHGARLEGSMHHLVAEGSKL